MSIKRNYLVVCRAGDSSLHTEWLKSNSRNFDIMIDYYGCERDRYAESCEYYIVENEGRKFSAIYKTILNNPALFEQYDAVWFPDDDLLTDTENINKMFELFQEHDLMLAQPALTTDSYYSHPVTLENSQTALRYTFYCEVMAPIFSREALLQCFHSFNLGHVGWGLDMLWPQILGYPIEKIAILDTTPVKHTRPIGEGEIYKDLEVHPRKELDILLKIFGIPNPIDCMSVYAGELRSSIISENLSKDMLNGLFASQILKGTTEKILSDELCVWQYLHPSLLKLNGLKRILDPDMQQTSDDITTSLKAFTTLKQGKDPAQVTNQLEHITDTTIFNLLSIYQGDQTELLNAIAIGFYQNEQHNRVMNYLTKAYEQNSKDNDTLYNLGYVLYQYGEKELSLRFLEMIESQEEYVVRLINEVRNAG